MARSPLVRLLALAAVGAFTFFAGRRSAPGVVKKGRKGTFVLVVEFDLENQEQVDQLLSAFKPLAAYVRDNEENTLSYEISVSDVKPFHVLILERYATKDYFLTVHRTSEPFLAFKKQLGELNFPIHGISYYEEGYGRV